MEDFMEKVAVQLDMKDEHGFHRHGWARGEEGFLGGRNCIFKENREQ